MQKKAKTAEERKHIKEQVLFSKELSLSFASTNSLNLINSSSDSDSTYLCVVSITIVLYGDDGDDAAVVVDNDNVVVNSSGVILWSVVDDVDTVVEPADIKLVIDPKSI